MLHSDIRSRDDKYLAGKANTVGEQQSGGFFSSRGRLLDCLPIFFNERLQFVALLGVLFAQPDHFSNDFYVEAVALGFQVNFLLGICT
jgi:hypothetical protein